MKHKSSQLGIGYTEKLIEDQFLKYKFQLGKGLDFVLLRNNDWLGSNLLVKTVCNSYLLGNTYQQDINI